MTIRDELDRAIARQTVGKLAIRLLDQPTRMLDRRIRDLSDAELDAVVPILEKLCGMRE
jgi:hypothetical protein